MFQMMRMSTTSKETIIYLEHVDKFLVSPGGAEEARSVIGLAVDTLAHVKVASSSTINNNNV